MIIYETKTGALDFWVEFDDGEYVDMYYAYPNVNPELLVDLGSSYVLANANLMLIIIIIKILIWQSLSQTAIIQTNRCNITAIFLLKPQLRVGITALLITPRTHWLQSDLILCVIIIWRGRIMPQRSAPTAQLRIIVINAAITRIQIFLAFLRWSFLKIIYL